MFNFYLNFVSYSLNKLKIMEILNKTLTLERGEYYEKHIAIINAIASIGLTKKEIEVLAAFMLLTGDIGEDRFGTTARKFVKNKLNLSDGGLGNHLRILKEKLTIILSGKKLEINPMLIPNDSKQLYNIKLYLNERS